MDQVCGLCGEEKIRNECHNPTCDINTTSSCIICGNSFAHPETRCTRHGCADNVDDDEDVITTGDIYDLEKERDDQIDDEDWDNEKDDDRDIDDKSGDRDD